MPLKDFPSHNKLQCDKCGALSEGLYEGCDWDVEFYAGWHYDWDADEAFCPYCSLAQDVL